MTHFKKLGEVLSTVLVIVAAGIFIYDWYTRPEAPKAQAAIADVEEKISADFLRNSHGSGDLAIIEFTDFECPFCARHATETIPELKKAIEGKARYFVVNLPLGMHKNAIPAAEASECAAEQGAYWEYHDALFAHQKELANIDYLTVARDLKLDEARFVRCLSEDKALARVEADGKEASRLKVGSTPSLFIGRIRKDGGADLLRRVSGAHPLDTFVTEIANLKQ